MKIKKKLFKTIKENYINCQIYSKAKANGYEKKLANYEPKYGSKQVMFERYIYYNTAVEIYSLILKDFEKLEGIL